MVNDYGVAALSCAFIEAIKYIARQEQWEDFSVEEIAERFLTQGNIQANGLTTISYDDLYNYLSPFFEAEAISEIRRCIEATSYAEPISYTEYERRKAPKRQKVKPNADEP